MVGVVTRSTYLRTYLPLLTLTCGALGRSIHFSTLDALTDYPLYLPTKGAH